MIRKEPTPGKAKRLGKNVLMRDNWDTIKVDVMRSLVTQKFSNDPNLQEKLLSTFDRPLVEGNHWKDTFWGVCNGVGQNNLGKILMEVRQQLKESI